MSAKDEAISKLEEAYTGFRERIADLPEDAYSERWLGEWSLDQLLAHMSGWFEEMSGAIQRVRQGERPAPPGVDYSNPEPWNEKFAANAKHGKDALAEWDAAYQQYLGAARSLPEDLYGTDPEKGRPRIGDRLLEGAGIGHFAEHRPQLEEWLSRRN